MLGGGYEFIRPALCPVLSGFGLILREREQCGCPARRLQPAARRQTSGAALTGHAVSENVKPPDQFALRSEWPSLQQVAVLPKCPGTSVPLPPPQGRDHARPDQACVPPRWQKGSQQLLLSVGAEERI